MSAATSQRPIRVLVVGGLTRLDPYYRATPEPASGERGLTVDVVYVDSGSLESRAAAADAIVLVTGQISHSAADKVRLLARRHTTPLVPATSASLSRVRAAIALAFVAARDGHRPSAPHLRLVPFTER